MKNPVIIFGASGLGRAVLEVFNSNNNVVYGFLDDDEQLHNTEIDSVPVLGSTYAEGFLQLVGKKCDAFIALDETAAKRTLTDFLLLKRKIMPTNAIHSSAFVARSVVMGHGNFINAGAIVGAATDMANHCILHSGATVDHSTKMEDFVQIGAGATISANVDLGENAFVGVGVVVVSGVTIGKNARIGAGSVVIADIADDTTVFGNPAKVVHND